MSKKNYLFALALIVCSSLMALTWQTTREDAASYLQTESEFWKPQIENGIKNQDERQLAAFSRLLIKEHFSSITISSGTQALFKDPNPQLNPELCSLHLAQKVRLADGQVVTITACSTHVREIKAIVSSPLFLSLLLALALALGLWFFLPLYHHHQSMLRMTDALWSNLRDGGSQESLGRIAQDTNDPLTAQFSNLFLSFAENQVSLQKQVGDLEKGKVISELAAQVAHDIRSPLSALNMAIAALGPIEKEKRALITSAISRINNIANDLLSQSKSLKKNFSESLFDQKPRSALALPTLVESLIREKQIRLGKKARVSLSSDFKNARDTLIDANPAEFSRVLSNLIDNAIESIERQGRVHVRIHRDILARVIVSIQDNGKGIPEDVLNRLGERGFSFGKTNAGGNGLGVYHAIKTVKSMGGTFSVQSKLGEGTLVSIVLPSASKPHTPTHTQFLERDLLKCSVGYFSPTT